MNIIYYAIIIPFLLKLPSFHLVPSPQPSQIPNFHPYYHHCARYNAGFLEVQKIKKHSPTCWMNYTTPVWLLTPPLHKIHIPRRMTASRPRYLDHPHIFRNTRTPPSDGLL